MIRLSISTDSRICFKDITTEINRHIENSSIKDGICCIFVPHTTAAVTVNEKADPNVIKDIAMALNKLIPFDDDYRHLEGNSAAHIKSSIIGASEILPVENGRLILGTWQAVFLCEFDGPRRRNVLLKVISERHLSQVIGES
jgi:secondary thiamine-phosphate synthase enzyme